MNLVKVGTLTAAVAAMSLMAGNAFAGIQVQDSGSIPFNLLNLGTGTSAGLQCGVGGPSCGTIIGNALATSLGITSIVFTGGSASGNSSDGSGVYAGNVTNVATTPYPLGTPGSSLENYLVAQANGGSVTITYANAQTGFDVLWGTADAATGYNVVACGGQGSTCNTVIQGSQINTAVSGTTNYAVEVSGLNPFTTLTFSDLTTSSAFEFNVGSVPEPGSLALMALGLAALGWVSRQRIRGRSRS